MAVDVADTPDWLAAAASWVTDRMSRETVQQWWWLAVLVVVSLPIHLLSMWRALSGPGKPPMGDSLIFEYYGWYMTKGGILYLEMWEVKPPLAYEIPAVVALLTGADPSVYHLRMVLVNHAFTLGAVLLVGLLVYELSENAVGALVAGLTPYVLPAFHLRASMGFNAKYAVIFFGLLGVYLTLQDRPALGGAAAAAALGNWQLAAVFPLVVLGLSVQRSGRRGAVRSLAAMAGVGALVVLPVVLGGALVPMLAETVFVAIYAGESYGLTRRIGWFRTLTGAAYPVFLLGFYGLFHRGLVSDRRRGWWLAVLGGWFTVQLLVFDFDFYLDLVPVAVVVALGVGSLVSLPEWPLEAPVGVLVAALVAFSVFSPVAAAGYGQPLPEGGEVTEKAEVTAPYNTNAERRALFWHRIEPETCHVFPGPTQRKWIELTGGELMADECGLLPPDVR